MARKKKEDINSDSLKARLTDSNAKDMPAIDQPITEMLEINYMPYAMSVIVSRAHMLLPTTHFLKNWLFAAHQVE